MGIGRIFPVFVILSAIIAVGDGELHAPQKASECSMFKLHASCSAALYHPLKPSYTCCREVRQQHRCLCLYLSFMHSPFSPLAVNSGSEDNPHCLAATSRRVTSLRAASPRVTSPRAATPSAASPRGYRPRPKPTLRNHHLSATKIQAAYRGYVARRSFRALRGLVLIPIAKPTGYTGADPYKIV
ncbi:hypothetical protein POM88_000278 [Heracleum sosnowskyi]|uniref:Bifunctional inhibitor/plant lipid transfer protein/seed storage helical domain-containing protein n=1 Tax=Heracleum sosnowskyi TaxID=360622 RepID=A0AAD8JB61_9APIA|nr:hypothetical protein POM88_000278 [Heracleum sosnowskyi]